VFNEHDGYVSVLYSSLHIGSTQRFPEVWRLTAEDIEALDVLGELAGDSELRLNLNFMPGDIQFPTQLCDSAGPLGGKLIPDLQKRSSSAKLIQQRLCFF
jgi:hypothetical protein